MLTAPAQARLHAALAGARGSWRRARAASQLTCTPVACTEPSTPPASVSRSPLRTLATLSVSMGARRKPQRITLSLSASSCSRLIEELRQWDVSQAGTCTSVLRTFRAAQAALQLRHMTSTGGKGGSFLMSEGGVPVK
jgi:hypothetical protein